MAVSSSQHYFRVHLDLPLAIQVMDPSGGAALRPVLARQLAVRARDVLGRMSASHHGDLRDALGSVLQAVEALEREVEMLHRKMFLSNQGIVLRSRRVALGGDGLTLLGPGIEDDTPGEGERVRVYLALSSTAGEQLLIVDGLADGGEVRFDDVEPALRDRLIAFVFDYQRRERRRELDSASSA